MTAPTNDTNDDIDSNSTATIPPSSKRCKLGSWIKRAQLQVAAQDESEPPHPQDRVKREMEDYEKSLRADLDSDPLDWWRVHSLTYPTLSKLAQKYLYINASSSASEMVFSTSGHIVSKK